MRDEQTKKRTREDSATQLNGYQKDEFRNVAREATEQQQTGPPLVFFLYSHLLSPASLPSPKLFLVETEDGDGQLGISFDLFMRGGH